MYWKETQKLLDLSINMFLGVCVCLEYILN